jgi:hypothetical protein
MLVHCTFEAAEAAAELRDRLRFEGVDLRYETLDKDDLARFDHAELFYLESGRILREAIGI